jgi:carboxymethylenebutenolidase
LEICISERRRKYTEGSETGESLLDSLRPRFAESRQVQPSDPRIEASFVTMDSPAGHGWLRSYLVKPSNPTGNVPGILVAHENRGLNPHIEDIARSLALEGFIAFSPDALSTVGGYPGMRIRPANCSSRSIRPRCGRIFSRLPPI